MRHPALLILLVSLAVARPAPGEERPWVETRSDHFVVASDAGQAPAEETARAFEELRSVFGALWPDARLDPGRPLLILLARDEKSLARLIPELWEGRRARPVGIFVRSSDRYTIALRGDARARPVGNIDYNPYFHVNHEYIHLLTDLNYPDLPLWLHEGLAEFYGNVMVKKDHVLQGLALPHHVLELRRRGPLPLEELLRAERSSPEYGHENRATTFYAQAWALVHMALTKPEGERARQLAEYIESSGSRRDPVEAARATFGDLKRLQSDLRSHYARSVFPYQRIDTAQSAAERTLETRSLSPAEVLALRGSFHVARGRNELGRDDLAGALRLDPQLPEPAAQLGLLAWRAGDDDQAVRFLERALAGGVRSPMAYVLHARLTAASDPSEETLAAAESHLNRALELEPAFAPAYELLADVKRARGESASACIELARRAVELEPREPRFRMSLARLLLSAGRLAEAEGEMEAALGYPSDDEEGQLEARGFLTRLRHNPLSDLLRGCREGDGESCRALGERYETGLGVEASAEEAVGYYVRGCENGDFASCFDAATAYLTGDGVARDAPRAEQLLERACEGGNAPSCELLAEVTGGKTL